MSFAETLAHLEHGFPLETAEARIRDWFSRGLVHYSDVRTKSTHLRRVSKCCLANVTELPAGVSCVRCGRAEWRKDTEGY